MSNPAENIMPKPEEGTELLKLNAISKTFYQGKSPVEVLQGLSMRVSAGEIVALVGPSGSGKSTLMQIAGLLDQPTSGQIVIQGRPAEKLNDHQRTLLRRSHPIGTCKPCTDD